MKMIFILALICFNCFPSPKIAKLCDSNSKGFLYVLLLRQTGNYNSAYCFFGERNQVFSNVTNSFTYSRNASSYLINVPIKNLAPTIQGKFVRFELNGNIPTGISFNSITGEFSGTPSAIFSTTSVKVEATEENGNKQSFDLSFRVFGTSAIRVYGQVDFTSASSTLSVTGLSSPTGIHVSNDGVYISCFNSHRVTFYPGITTTATRVYGQLGSFTTSVVNNMGISANSLNTPFNSFYSSMNNQLYIPDGLNHRVLVFKNNSTTAESNLIYGQTNLTSNTTGITASSLNQPSDVVEDSTGGLYIADRSNHRILYFNRNSTTASRAIGHDFVSAATIGITSSKFDNPVALAIDKEDGLYVADFSNNRVLYFKKGESIATRVYGQFGNFTSSTQNNGGVVSANSLNQPAGVAVDADGNLFISDTFNHRILFYPDGSTTATVVFGQTAMNLNSLGLSQIKFNGPGRIFIDKSGNLFVADQNNHRGLVF
jgi:hypothetical protein